MKKLNRKSLALNSETIRSLHGAQLVDAAGGYVQQSAPKMGWFISCNPQNAPCIPPMPAV